MTRLTDSVATTGQTTVAIPVLIVVVKTALTVWTVRVVGTVSAVTTVTRGPVQLSIKVTLATLPVTVAG